MDDTSCAVVRVAAPDPLKHIRSLVLDAVSSPLTKRQYEIALDRFIAWVAVKTLSDIEHYNIANSQPGIQR
jgi:hypothetical protein